MKKLLFVSLCLGLLTGLTSCQKEVGGTQEANATSTLTVTSPQDIATRAVADYGKGAQVNR